MSKNVIGDDGIVEATMIVMSKHTIIDEVDKVDDKKNTLWPSLVELFASSWSQLARSIQRGVLAHDGGAPWLTHGRCQCLVGPWCSSRLIPSDWPSSIVVSQEYYINIQKHEINQKSSSIRHCTGPVKSVSSLQLLETRYAKFGHTQRIYGVCKPWSSFHVPGSSCGLGQLRCVGKPRPTILLKASTAIATQRLHKTRPPDRQDCIDSHRFHTSDRGTMGKRIAADISVTSVHFFLAPSPWLSSHIN